MPTAELPFDKNEIKFEEIDGKTYNYEKGEYTYMTITVDIDSNGNKKGNVSIPEGKKVWSYNGEYTFRFMTK